MPDIISRAIADVKEKYVENLVLTRPKEALELLGGVACLYDDNGGDPDGSAWLPSDIITLAEARQVLDAGLGEMVEVRFASDETMAHFLYGPTAAVDMDDEDQVIHMQDEAHIRTAGWAHYGAYGAGDSLWTFIPICRGGNEN